MKTGMIGSGSVVQVDQQGAKGWYYFALSWLLFRSFLFVQANSKQKLRSTYKKERARTSIEKRRAFLKRKVLRDSKEKSGSLLDISDVFYDAGRALTRVWATFWNRAGRAFQRSLNGTKTSHCHNLSQPPVRSKYSKLQRDLAIRSNFWLTGES